MEIAAFVVAVVSALGTVGAVIVALIARSDAAKADRDAAKSAERATQAAERMAFIQSQVFDGPPWAMSWFGGDTFLLTNHSPLAALNVNIAPDPDELRIQVAEAGPWTIGPKSAVKFMFAPHMGMGMKRDLVVSWQRDGSDDVLEWRHPIPTREDKR